MQYERGSSSITGNLLVGAHTIPVANHFSEMLVLYVLLLLAKNKVDSRRLLQHPADTTPGQHHGVFLRPARKLAAGSSLPKGTELEQKGG
jgi:hypothetical protein